MVWNVLNSQVLCSGWDAECPMMCVVETGRALKARIAENGKAVTNGDFRASALAEHVGVQVTLSCLTKYHL